jgi:hypothetical protein
MAEKTTTSTGSGCGCISIILTVIFILILIGGFTYKGKRYELSCSCTEGVELEETEVPINR